MRKAWTIKSGIILVFLAVGLICTGGCKKKESAPAEPPPVDKRPIKDEAPPEAKQPAPADATADKKTATAKTDGAFDKLVGSWIRTDGGYVIQIRLVAADGTLDAGYFNPNPINVSEAKATKKADSVEVFLELRDINYPGSNYTLTYDPKRDALVGNYFQAVQRQTFAVEFIRKK
ncbi:MAG: hypothetical protein JXM70_10665 [Pirellulales bacterium]|nr:hypothetical protein [Pirellulales bacterium]